MQHLDLSPLPCAVPTENSRPSVNSGLGFVDDTVVLALLAGTMDSRPSQDTRTLALAADAMDYAGWPPFMLAGVRFA